MSIKNATSQPSNLSQNRSNSNGKESTVGVGKTQNSTMTKNITKMVIASLFISVLSQIPYSVCFIISWLTTINTPLFNTVNTASVFCILIGPCSDLFIYYFFNKLFRNVIDDILVKFY